MMAGMITLILIGLLRGIRTHRALVLENLALRHQLAVLQRSAPRLRLRRSDRLFWVLLSRLWSGWPDGVSIVQPATVIRWQRTGFKLFWTWKSRRNGPGRPVVSPEIRALIRRMSTRAPRRRRSWCQIRVDRQRHQRDGADHRPETDAPCAARAPTARGQLDPGEPSFSLE
jgi:hypothetical protein